MTGGILITIYFLKQKYSNDNTQKNNNTKLNIYGEHLEECQPGKERVVPK